MAGILGSPLRPAAINVLTTARSHMQLWKEGRKEGMNGGREGRFDNIQYIHLIS